MNPKTEIPIRCEGSRYVSYKELKAFQGNLKEMSKENAEKLKKSILKHGWVAPVFVWNKTEIIDGHGRLLVLGELINNGSRIGKIPVVDIEAKNKKEAAQILLEINSHYQTVTDQGLYEFMSDMDLKFGDLENIELPDIDLKQFEKGYFIPDENKPIDEEAMSDTKNECPKCGFKW